MDSFELMDWEQTLPEQTRLQQHHITASSNSGIARPFNIESGYPATPIQTALIDPVAAEGQQRPRKRLERSSPQTKWLEMLATCDDQKKQTSITPRKRGLEEIYAPGEAPQQTVSTWLTIAFVVITPFIYKLVLTMFSFPVGRPCHRRQRISP